MGDIATGRLLPMESDGVPIEDYQRKKFLAEKIYCEVCRVVIHPDYRRHRLHVRLLEAASIILPQEGCHIVYWLAKRSQAVNSHRSLKSLGLRAQDCRIDAAPTVGGFQCAGAGLVGDRASARAGDLCRLSPFY